jgi:hypothetical protein
MQQLHIPHGSAPDEFVQFKAFANTLAADVLPVPRIPQKR